MLENVHLEKIDYKIMNNKNEKYIENPKNIFEWIEEDLEDGALYKVM